MVTGSTERGITSQGSMEQAASPYRALESSDFGGTKHCGAGFWCLAGQGGMGGKSVCGRGPSSPNTASQSGPLSFRKWEMFSLEKLNKHNIGLENTKYGGRWRVRRRGGFSPFSDPPSNSEPPPTSRLKHYTLKNWTAPERTPVTDIWSSLNKKIYFPSNHPDKAHRSANSGTYITSL